MVFKHQLTPLGKKGQIHTHKGKGSSAQLLPSRHAMSTLTGGDATQRGLNNYAKATPMAAPAAVPAASPMAPPMGPPMAPDKDMDSV